MERMHSLPNHFSSEVMNIASAQAQGQDQAWLQRSLGKVFMRPGGKETVTGELSLLWKCVALSNLLNRPRLSSPSESPVPGEHKVGSAEWLL